MKLPKAYAQSVPKKTIDMTLSVNPLGVSPRVLKTLNTSITKNISIYPDEAKLKKAISQNLKVPARSIVLGTGSEQLIKLACLAFVRANDTVCIERGSFFLFTKEAKLAGGKVQFVNVESPKRVSKKPALLFLANPTTPGGVDRSDMVILRTIDTFQPDITVIDEANGEYRKNSFIPQALRRKNIVVLRTFSKALGLAGLRIGYAVGNPDLISRFSDFQQPFPVSCMALIAAKIALSDRAFLKKTLSFVATERRFLSDALKTRGFNVSASITNNLFLMSPNAKQIIQELKKQDVSVIDGSYFPGNFQTGFRISIKDKLTNRLFLKKLDKALSCVPNQNLLRSKEVI